MMSDLEKMDAMLGSGEYNPFEGEINQMTGFSNMLDRNDNEDIGLVRGTSSQENEIRNKPVNRNNQDFSRNLNSDRRNEP